MAHTGSDYNGVGLNQRGIQSQEFSANIYADLENSVNDYAQIGFRNWQYMQRMK